MKKGNGIKCGICQIETLLTVDNPIVETVEKPTFTTEELVAMLEEKGYEVSLKHIYKLV